jgi:hypothetical protein
VRKLLSSVVAYVVKYTEVLSMRIRVCDMREFSIRIQVREAFFYYPKSF